jgi:hypothetical protein
MPDATPTVCAAIPTDGDNHHRADPRFFNLELKNVLELTSAKFTLSWPACDEGIRGFPSLQW